MTTTLRRPIAVVVSRFPLVTETFVLRELIELEKQGQPVLLAPLLRERPSVVHSEAQPWIERAFYTAFLSWRVIRANLRAFVARPGRYLGVLAKLVATSATSPDMLGKTLVLWPKYVALAEHFARHGIGHVHAHFATHPAAAAFVAAQLHGTSFSITIHAHDIFVDRASLAPKVRAAAFVRCVSEFNRRFLLQCLPDLDPSKAVVIHVGVPRRHLAPAAPAAGRDPQILCVAALKPYKGLHVLLEACRIMKQQNIRFHCRIVGDGPLRAELERETQALDVGDRVAFEGALPQDAVSAAMRGATIVVHPSVVATNGQMDGIPVALMEAMAIGRPVIASDLSGIPELVQHERSGLLVPPGDAAALASAIERLIDDPALGWRLGAAAAATVRGGFDLEETVRRLAAHIDRFNPRVELPVEAAPEVAIRRVWRRGDAELIELGAPSTDERWILKRHVGPVHRGRGPTDRAQREFGVLSRLSADRVAAPQRWAGLSTPQPLALRASNVLMTRCDGTPLDAIVRRARSGDAAAVALATDAVRRAGEWLRLFQRVGRHDAPDPLPTLLEHAEADLRLCVERGLLPPGANDSVKLRELAGAVPPVARHAVPTHGDFWPGNVLVGDDVSVVDFEGVDRGFGYEDPGYFLIHLELYFQRPGLRSLRQRLGRAFVDGFTAGAGADHAALRLCRATAALRALAHSRHQGSPIHDALRRRLFRAVVLDAASAARPPRSWWRLAEAR